MQQSDSIQMTTYNENTPGCQILPDTLAGNAIAGNAQTCELLNTPIYDRRQHSV